MDVKRNKIDVKLIELISSKNALDALNKISFKALNAYKIKKIVKAANDEIQIFNDLLNDKRASLLKDKEPSQEAVTKFETEMNEAAEIIVTLDIPNVNLSWFARSNGAINENTDWHDFEPAHFQALSWLIVDDVG